MIIGLTIFALFVGVFALYAVFIVLTVAYFASRDDSHEGFWGDMCCYFTDANIVIGIIIYSLLAVIGLVNVFQWIFDTVFK